MKATWDDSESGSAEDDDTANVCIMAQSDYTHKIQSEPTLYDAELTFDDLALSFEE